MTKLSKAPEQVADIAQEQPQAAPAAVAEVQPAVPEEVPGSGGCWIRMPDGSLVRDRAEHPEEEA